MLKLAVKAEATRNDHVARNLTSRSTRPAVAWLSWCFLTVWIEGCSRGRVNSSVMSPLCMDMKLNPAAPLLSNTDVDETIEKPVECGGELNQPVMKADGLRHQLSRSR
jgi:hypothetical protein